MFQETANIITLTTRDVFPFQWTNSQGNPTWSRADSRLAPSQWETALLCNDVSHWLGASLESALLANNSYPHIAQLHNSITEKFVFKCKAKTWESDTNGKIQTKAIASSFDTSNNNLATFPGKRVQSVFRLVIGSRRVFERHLWPGSTVCSRF